MQILLTFVVASYWWDSARVDFGSSFGFIPMEFALSKLVIALLPAVGYRHLVILFGRYVPRELHSRPTESRANATLLILPVRCFVSVIVCCSSRR